MQVEAAVKRTAAAGRSSERLRQRIIDGDREGLTAELDEALGSGISALDIVNDILLDGMREVSASCSAAGRCSCRSCSSRRRR